MNNREFLIFNNHKWKVNRIELDIAMFQIELSSDLMINNYFALFLNISVITIIDSISEK